jgi:hypothetical protein
MVHPRDAGNIIVKGTGLSPISSLGHVPGLPSASAAHESSRMASEKSKILVVGATGHLGRHVVAASARQGHPTLALVRDTAPSDAAKAALLQSFQDAGVTLVKGDLHDQASLLSAVGLRTWSGHLHGRGAADR